MLNGGKEKGVFGKVTVERRTNIQLVQTMQLYSLFKILVSVLLHQWVNLLPRQPQLLPQDPQSAI